MRLLDTTSGLFYTPTDLSLVPYAILSHTWSRKGEQSYQELLLIQDTSRQSRRKRSSLRSRCLHQSSPQEASTDDTPKVRSILADSRVWQKIRETCRVAREDGYRFVWIDSCCIDKSSSAELSEAINSMFEWYRQAEICYVYLEDVGDDDHPPINQPEQELSSSPSSLSVPPSLSSSTIFSTPSSQSPSSSSSGKSLESSSFTSNSSLTAPAVSTVTSFPQFRASRWHTRGWTLQELIAPRYHVFLSRDWRPFGTKLTLARILEEVTGISCAILNHERSINSVTVAERMSWAATRETSREEDEAYALMGIFGVHMPTIYGEGRHAFLRLQEEILKTHSDQSIFIWGQDPFERSKGLPARCGSRRGLLADCPRCFIDTPRISTISHDELLRRLAISEFVPPAEFTSTPHGIRARLPLFPMSIVFALCDDGQYFAILPCEDSRGDLLVLSLHRVDTSSMTSREYVVGTSNRGHRPNYRVWRLSSDDIQKGVGRIVFTEVLLTPYMEGWDDRVYMDFIGSQFTMHQVILQNWSLAVLERQGYHLTCRSRARGAISMLDGDGSPFGLDQSPLLVSHVFVLTSQDKTEKMSIYVGEDSESEMYSLPDIAVTHETSANTDPDPCCIDSPDPSPISAARLLYSPCRDGTVQPIHRRCLNGKTGQIYPARPGWQAQWWSFDLVYRENLMRTLRVGLSRRKPRDDQEGSVCQLTIELSETFRQVTM